MSRTIPVFVFLLAFFMSASARTADSEVTTTIAWRMSLDANGRVSSLEPWSNTVDALREKLEPVVREWEFEPGAINGLPAATETMLSVQVTLLPAGEESLAIRVDDIRTGGFISEQMPPRMPPDEAKRILRNDGFAQVVFEVSYDQSGKPTSVSVLEGSTQTRGRLVESGKKAVGAWSFEPERVAGLGVPGKLIVPICYTVAGSQRAAMRLGEKCAWTRPGSKTIVEQGQSLALDSRVRLKSDVIGKTI